MRSAFAFLLTLTACNAPPSGTPPADLSPTTGARVPEEHAPGDRMPEALVGTYDADRAACAETMTATRLVVSPDTLRFYYGYATVDSVAARAEGYDVRATLYQLEGVEHVVPEPATYRVEGTGSGVQFGWSEGESSPLVRCGAAVRPTSAAAARGESA